jgi:hypothetical protein
LLSRPEVTPLTAEWINGYDARRIATKATQPGIADEPPEDAPKLLAIQAEALAALAATRAWAFWPPASARPSLQP